MRISDSLYDPDWVVDDLDNWRARMASGQFGRASAVIREQAAWWAVRSLWEDCPSLVEVQLNLFVDSEGDNPRIELYVRPNLRPHILTEWLPRDGNPGRLDRRIERFLNGLNLSIQAWDALSVTSFDPDNWFVCAREALGEAWASAYEKKLLASAIPEAVVRTPPSRRRL